MASTCSGRKPCAGALRVVELAQGLDEPLAEATGRHLAVGAMIATGDLEGAEGHVQALQPLGERLRIRGLGAAHSATVYRLRGDWKQARGILDRTLAMHPSDPRPLASLALLEYEVGDFGKGEAYVKRIGETPWGGRRSWRLGSLVLLAGVQPHLNKDLEDAEKFISTGPNLMNEVLARIALASVAVVRGDEEGAAKQYEALLPRRNSMVSGWGLLSLMATDRLLGLLAHTMGKPDVAAAHFEDALAFCRKAGYRPELAWSLWGYADTLHERDGDGDREKAVSLLDESLAIASELGMRPLMERVLSRREHLKA